MSTTKTFRKTLLFFIITALLFACKNDKIEKIYVDVDKNFDMFLSDNQVLLGATLKVDTIINIQTTDNIIIGRVNKVDFYNNRYYVLDSRYSNCLFCFDAKGNLVNNTSIGKGPGEIIKIRDFNVNKTNEQIEVWDGNATKLLKYSLDLEFMSEKRFPHIYVSNFKTFNDSLIIAHVFSDMREDGRLDNYYIFSSNTGEVKNIFFPVDKSFSALLGINSISSYNKRILLACLADYNIYELKKNHMTIKYKVDFGKYKVTPDDIAKGGEYVINLFLNNKVVLGLKNLTENKDFISFGYYLKVKEYLFSCIYSKKTKKTYCASSFHESMIPKLEIKGVLPDNRFVGVIQPENLKRYYNKKNIPNNIKDTDNPSLVIFRLIEK